MRDAMLWDIRTWPRWGKLTLVVVLLIAAGAGAWVSRDWLVERREGPRKALRSLVMAQEQFKQSCVIDMDGDGMGEYGWLGELSGVEACRGHQMTMNTSPYVVPALGTKDRAGRSHHSGLVWQMALPLPGDRWELEPGKLPAQGYPADLLKWPKANLREVAWLCYAWPAETSLDQRLTYYVSQSGNIWMTEAKVTPYRGAAGPRVSAAFPKSGQGPPTPDLAPIYIGADGNTWSFIAWR